ncbi:MAG TPA: DUF4142 domain-containing protein [Beijerinckiaceae bacterium]|nr:DUF4142 domain-containing protein [Beijerinckiaceae bacterium]
MASPHHLALRRALRIAAGAALSASALSTSFHPVAAQPAATAPAPQAIDPATFVRVVRSLAILQARAAEHAASRETRPETRAFAQKMAAFRGEQLPKLDAVARERQVAVGAVLEFEHQVILENLQPLDSLELSRRYAELQLQALEQEIRAYGAAERAPDERLRGYAAELRPRLEQLLEEARAMRQAVGP